MIINEINARYDELVDHQLSLFFPAYNDQSRLKSASLGSSRSRGLVLFPEAELQPGGSALHMEDICTRLFPHVETACLSACTL